MSVTVNVRAFLVENVHIEEVACDPDMITFSPNLAPIILPMDGPASASAAIWAHGQVAWAFDTQVLELKKPDSSAFMNQILHFDTQNATVVRGLVRNG